MMTSISLSQTAQQRQQFPALANKAYFNYGGQGPMPQAAIEAINQAQEYIQIHGPFSTKVNAWIAEEVKQTRKVIASELNTSIDTITITEDVTVGCNIALWGIDWQAGDHILLTDCEHPGVIATTQEISRRFNVEVSFCPIMATLNSGDPAEVIAKNLTPNTRLVVLSHILWNTGQVLPVNKIVQVCRNYNTRIQILVDAAQSVGLLPLNLTELEADFYAFTGHKWWCGPMGVGGLYVRPEARESLRPTFIGWRSITMDSQGKPVDWQPDGRRYEIATSAFGQYCGLRAAIATHQQWGSATQRYEQILQLSHYLWQRLNELSDIVCLRATPPASSLVSFQLKQQPGSHKQLVQYLESQNMMTRTLLDPDCVRACVHYFTTTSEIDQLITKIESYCRK